MTGSGDDITCHVRTFRKTKGWSQARLAEQVGVKRQAIYDIESGRYLPNTAVALKLARCFGCRVEDLFVPASSTGKEPVTLVGRGTADRIAAARIRGSLVGFPLDGAGGLTESLSAADALVSPNGHAAELLCSETHLDNTLVLMGCDPAFDILGTHVRRRVADVRLLCRFASSHEAMERLSVGLTHLGGTHLHNRGDQEANVTAARQALSTEGGMVVGFSLVEEGLIVAKGNPLKIRSVADLTREDVRYVNREPGAALRVLLDDLLQTEGVLPDEIYGYDDLVYSHAPGARKVLFGLADAALGLRVVAETFDLDFVPLDLVRCDLVIPSDMMDLNTTKVVLDVLQSKALRRELSAIPGYETRDTGRVISRI